MLIFLILLNFSISPPPPLSKFLNYSSGDLKKQLEQVCGVPVCRQQISGLGGSRAMSSAQLHTLSLPHNAVLRLKAAEQLMADDE